MDYGFCPCPTQEGGSIYLNGFSDGPKPYEEVLTFLRKGTAMLKYGRMGAPKYHPFRISNDDTELQWESKKGQVRRIHLRNINRWERGQATSNFRKYPHPEMEEVSFSLHYKDESNKDRTLDVICRNRKEFEMWFWGMQVVTYYPPTRFYMGTVPTSPTAQPRALPSSISGPVEQQQRSMPQSPAPVEAPNRLSAPSADDRRPKATQKAPAKTTLSSMVTNMRSSGTSAGMPQLGRREREMGDLYVWGSLTATDADEVATVSYDPTWEQESLRDCMSSKGPTLLQNATSVDVMRVSCAPRHAAIITRNGELYTWGYGKECNLGHGWCGNVSSPRLVARMGGRGVRAVSCGEGASAAISADYRLFMWGKGMAGQLGNGYDFPCAEPTPVLFPGLREDAKVLAVSCGPYHTAAITENGLLFTWGNGLFGKLGHGSHESEYRPRRVTDLEDKFVVNVSCGYWHTAAVVTHRNSSRKPTSQAQSGELSPQGNASGSHAQGTRHLASAASAPSMSAPGDGGGEDGGQGVVPMVMRERSRTADMSSSGSDFHAAVSAVAASMATSRGAPSGSCGGVEQAGGPRLRNEELSGSVASLDKLDKQEAASEDNSASPSGNAGMLYTWGCDFSWMEGCKVDHHSGCLGVGDKQGRLAPTRVRGDMDKHGVVQVACGWSMTVALSADGRVYQMGRTGAYTTADKSCSWEGALVPTRVDGNLFNMHVEEVACGMRHVVVVASKVQANGQIANDQRRVRLLTWGCGGEGQLGLWGMTTSADAPIAVRTQPQQMDHHLPQVVGSLDGRRVLHIAAGGNLTMAVMEHDHRTRRSNPGPLSASTPTNASATPSGGGAQSRSIPYGPHMSSALPVAVSARELGGGLSSFQLSQSLPMSVAAAGLQSLQSLQQMVSASVGTRSKAGTPTGTAGSSSDAALMARPGIPRRTKRMVGIPQPLVGQSRGDHHHHHHLRRSAARTLPGTPHLAGGALASGKVSQKALSVSVPETKALDAPASVSSGVASHRSSPPLGQRSEDADSRSTSPTSGSLYEISSAANDYQPSRHPRAADADARARGGSAESGATVSSFTAVIAAAQSDFSRSPHRGGGDDGGGGSAGSVHAAETQSLGDNSTVDTHETDTDSIAQGGRSLDMVPEQSESPGSPTQTARQARLAGSTAHPHLHPGGAVAAGGAGPHRHAYGRDVLEITPITTQVTSPGAPSTGMAPGRLSRLGQQASGAAHAHAAADAAAAAAAAAAGDGSIGETVRSSVSTADSSYTAAESASSELSPKGIRTTFPETAGESDAMGMAGMPSSYGVPEEQAPGPSISALPATRHGSLAPGPAVAAQEALSRGTQSPSAPGAAGSGPSTPGGSGRNREVNIASWAQPPPGPGSAHPSFRSDGSMRAQFGVLADVAAVGGGGGGVAVAAPGRGGLRKSGSRGSRGHSRHASYDSLDLGSRDGEVSNARGGSMPAIAAGFDARTSAFSLHGGAAAAANAAGLSPPPQAWAAADAVAANPALMAVMQQNEHLMKEVEALRQQLALVTQAATLGAAMASVGAHPYPQPPPPPPVPPPQQVSAAAATAPAVHGSPPGMAAAAAAAGGSMPVHPLGVGSAAAHFGDSSGVYAVPSSVQGHGFPTVAVPPRGPPPAAPLPPLDRLGSAAGAPPTHTAPPGGRHHRSASIDVSSLIATRDGIGPAKDYLAPAARPGLTAPTGHHQQHHGLERAPSAPRDGTALGHHTAPPALEGLRQSHPGMSLVQAALAEEEDADNDMDDDEEAEEEDAGAGEAGSTGASSGGEADDGGSQGAVQRQVYMGLVHQQKAQVQPAPQLPRRSSAAQLGLPLEVHAGEPSLGAAGGLLKEAFGVQPSETSYRSSTSGDGTGASEASGNVPGASTASEADAGREYAPAGSGGGGGGIWRSRRVAFVEWANTMHREMADADTPTIGGGLNPGSSGGGGGAGSGRAGLAVEAGGGSGAGGAGAGGEDSFAGGSVALAPLPESLPAEGKIFQYAPGVFVTLKPPQQPGERIEMVKIRFNRRFFSPAGGKAWWNAHKAALYEMYKVTASAAQPSTASRPPLAPASGSPSAAAAAAAAAAGGTHTRGLSNDTQGTSAGSTSASGSSLYFSMPINAPVHGLGGPGSGGSAVSSGAGTAGPSGGAGGDGRLMWVSGSSAATGAGGGGAVVAAGSDASWADVNYDDPDMLLPPAGAGLFMPGGGMAGAAAPRHHRSRSGSQRTASSSQRTASGGSSHAMPPRPPAVGMPAVGMPAMPLQCPESPVLALQQVGSGSGGGSAYASAGAVGAPVTAPPFHHGHKRSRSGGASSGAP